MLRIKPLYAAMLLATIMLLASQSQTITQTIQHVICDSGCGAGTGAVTVADGADVAQGTTTDAAVTTNTTGTLSGKLRGLVAILADVWDSTNHWLQVKVMNAVAVTQSGTWTVQPGNTANTTAWKVDGSAVTQPVSGTVTANQGGSPWAENITQFGTTNVVTGIGPAVAGAPRVTMSDDDTVGSGTINATTACPGASTVATTSAGCVVIPMAARVGASVFLNNTGLTATLQIEQSLDGGTTWGVALVLNGSQQLGLNVAFTTNTSTQTYDFIFGEGVSHVRVRATALSAGSTVASIRATKIVSPIAVGALNVFNSGTTPAVYFTGNIGGRSYTAVPTAVTAGSIVPLSLDVYGAPYVRSDHPNRFRCNMDSSATTSTVITGCVGSAATLAAPAAGLAYYITDISFYVSVISTTTNRSVIQTGTGGTCGTGTSILWAGYAGVAFTGSEAHFTTPLRASTIGEVCFLNAVAGQKLMTISGFLSS